MQYWWCVRDVRFRGRWWPLLYIVLYNTHTIRHLIWFPILHVFIKQTMHTEPCKFSRYSPLCASRDRYKCCGNWFVDLMEWLWDAASRRVVGIYARYWLLDFHSITCTNHLGHCRSYTQQSREASRYFRCFVLRASILINFTSVSARWRLCKRSVTY